MENLSKILVIIIVILPVFIFLITMIVIKNRTKEKVNRDDLLAVPEDKAQTSAKDKNKEGEAQPVKKAPTT